MLRAVSPGIRAIYVDRGRQHHQAMGLTESGPMDEYAFLWSNRLLANPCSSAALEITMGLARFEALTDSVMAICGADFAAAINGRPLDNWSSFNLVKGDLLTFKASQRRGIVAYLAIKGGFHCPNLFSSCCTVEREGLGGNNQGQKLIKGETLHATQASLSGPDTVLRTVAPELIPNYANDQPITLRFIPGYQWPLFAARQQQHFVTTAYAVTDQSDRMGIRLRGPGLSTQTKSMISEAIALGAIQVPPDGLPIVLMRDRQTIGGYPKLGTVLSTDIERLAQAMPGQTLRFSPVPLQLAYQERVSRERFFRPTDATKK